MVAPSRWWWLAVVLLWPPLILLGVVCALALPLNLVLVPAWLACAGSVGTLARRINEPRCIACESGAPAEVAGREARPAHERPMESALV